jgi:hypothetical protein
MEKDWIARSSIVGQRKREVRVSSGDFSAISYLCRSKIVQSVSHMHLIVGFYTLMEFVIIEAKRAVRKGFGTTSSNKVMT